jgi:ABC-type transporter Mla subunit MlaD
MNAGQLAALIAAGFWAVLVCAAVYVLARLARLISIATRAVTGYRDHAEELVTQARAAVDRTNEQLARTDAITSSMDQVTANMAELSGHVSDLAGVAGGISAVFGTPLMRLSATAFGIRRAVAIRRSVRVPALDQGGRARR